jgi:hypothetical protein
MAKAQRLFSSWDGAKEGLTLTVIVAEHLLFVKEVDTFLATLPAFRHSLDSETIQRCDRQLCILFPGLPRKKKIHNEHTSSGSPNEP